MEATLIIKTKPPKAEVIKRIFLKQLPSGQFLELHKFHKSSVRKLTVASAVFCNCTTHTACAVAVLSAVVFFRDHLVCPTYAKPQGHDNM